MHIFQAELNTLLQTNSPGLQKWMSKFCHPVMNLNGSKLHNEKLNQLLLLLLLLYGASACFWTMVSSSSGSPDQMSFYEVKATRPCLTSRLDVQSVSVCTSFKICPAWASVIISKAETKRYEMGVTYSTHGIHEKCIHNFFVRSKHEREDNIKMNLTGW